MALLWVFIAWTKLCADLQYFEGYNAEHALNPVLREESEREGYRRIDLTFEAIPGEPVPVLMALPPDGAGPFPAIVFLHGIGQKKEFLDEMARPFADAGFILATFDQYSRGERKVDGRHALAKPAALYWRGSYTVRDTRRLVDYLASRPDVDSSRFYLIGASYGAMTGATAAALEPRFKAVSLVYGGGGFGDALAERGRGPVGRWFWSRVGAWVDWALHPFDPVRHVGRIAPRPVYFQNGDRDRIVQPALARNLFEAASEPKEITWYPSDHLDLDPQYIPIAVKDGIAWFKEIDGKRAAANPSGG